MAVSLQLKNDLQGFVAEDPKVLPLILLLDVSGSMAGEKIEALRRSIDEMIASLHDAPFVRITVITFGDEVSSPIRSLRPDQIRDFRPVASGGTPMGAAISEAKALVEDRDTIKKDGYRPILLLASDGHPTDEWKVPLDAFVSTGRSSKCDRLAIPIGGDCDHSVLLAFVGGDPAAMVPALRAADIQQAFRLVTMSVTTRTRSRTPNIRLALPVTPAPRPTGPPKAATSSTTAPANAAGQELGVADTETMKVEPRDPRGDDSGGEDGGNGFW